jgi:hypothetical protein
VFRARASLELRSLKKGSGKHLELKTIQAHITQKPLLWIEAGAHAVRKRLGSDGGQQFSKVMLDDKPIEEQRIKLNRVPQLP